jgi:hypothetical protein
VDVQSAPSDAEDPDVERSPSKRGKGKGKKDSAKKGKSKKKRDGWIWLESLMRGQGQSDEKLAAYKKESEWQCISIQCRLYTNTLQVTECSGSVPKQKCTAGWSSMNTSTRSCSV